jgi:dihydrofolate reductase
MSKIFFDVGLSLDGFLAGNNRGPDNPLGDNGTTIHEWMFRQKAFHRTHNMEGGEEDGPDGKLIENIVARIGSNIMGKRMFEEGEKHWPEDLFKTDVYVLTHEKRQPWVQKGTTTFYFINDGIESALEKAKKSAKTKDVRISGGANTIQQYMNAGLIDEFTVHIAPVINRQGLRLFDGIDRNKYDVAIEEIIPSRW